MKMLTKKGKYASQGHRYKSQQRASYVIEDYLYNLDESRNLGK